MNAVGIDVSKGKSMVAIMRPFGEIVSTPFEIKHTSSDINSLVKLIKSIEGESRIVMEHTGRYYEVLAHQLSEANLFVSAINPKLIKDFDNDSLLLFIFNSLSNFVILDKGFAHEKSILFYFHFSSCYN